MIEVDRQVEVRRTPEEVFRFIADFANMPEWDPGVVSATRLTDGPVGKNTRYRLNVAWAGRRVMMEYRVLAWEPARRALLEGVSEGVLARDEICFAQCNGGTRVRWRASLELQTAGRLMELGIKPLFEFYARRTMRHLAEAFAPHRPPRPGLSRRVADRLIVPGVLGFTRLGYSRQRRNWSPMTCDMRGRTCVVTGATSGLGKASAERLAALGADVILVGRDPQKLDGVLTELRRRTGSQCLRGEVADLGLMHEVAALAGRLQAMPALHVLINNAGVLLNTRQLTSEGFEESFATNLLGHYLLTRRLLPKLQESAPARIINVSSGGMYTQRVRVDDLQSARGRWDGRVAYARAKRGQVILSEMLAEQLRGSGVVINAMHPGWADTPGVVASLPLFYRLTAPLLRTPEQGADTIVWLACADEAATVTGQFWLDRQPRETHLLPGTRETAADRQALWDSLAGLVAPWLAD